LAASAFGGGAAGTGGGDAGAVLAAGFASSSEMMRLIDARISSIEGSCAFAGCDISLLHPHSIATKMASARALSRIAFRSL
jgi:hypothetical protein